MERYFTIAGAQYRFGTDFIKAGMPVRLVKEPDNKFDREAIRVEMTGLGLIGYVANSVSTVLGESDSAGRLYDKIPDETIGEVRFVTDKGIICTVEAYYECPIFEDYEEEEEYEVVEEDEEEEYEEE